VAGLAVVDLVVESVDGLTAHVCLEAEDTRRLEALIEHVHLRQRASS
jgi:hypothetical protein